METVTIKYNVLRSALSRLEESLLFLNNVKSQKIKTCLTDDHEAMYMIARDSAVQRFEFCVELFWKYIRLFLEQVEKVTIEANTPRGVIRAACQARIISEREALLWIEMIKGRNLTSHIYKEDIAEQLASDIPGYYDFMINLLSIVQPKGLL